MTPQPSQQQLQESTEVQQARTLLEQTIRATDERSKDFDYIQRVAKPMAVSGLFGPSQEILIAKMMVGEALGIHPATAMQQLHLIEGKVQISSGLMLALARQRGWRHQVKCRDEKSCVIAWTDPTGVMVGESAWTLEDAKRVKLPPKDGKERSLLDKDNWRNYPKNMLFARAVSDGIRTYCPEIMNGIAVYTPEEMQDIIPDPAKPAIQMPERASAAGSEPGAAA